MSLTQEREFALTEPGADWRTGQGEGQTFGQLFSVLLEQKGIDRSALATRMADSPFNRGEDGMARVSRDSILTKLGRWAKDKAVPEDREELFQLCILAGLTADMARNLFEKGLRASWVHMGSRSEMIYLFCLEYGYDIQTAWELMGGAQPEAQPNHAAMDGGMQVRTVTRHLHDAYGNQKVAFGLLQEEGRLAAFREFLGQNRAYFHTVRQKRVRIYQSFCEATILVDTGEGDADGNAIQKEEKRYNITRLADLLRQMRVPDMTDISHLEAATSRRRIEKMLLDNKLGDSNPIRKDIPRYLSGEKDIPRDIFIKTYILTSPDPDIWDLEACLSEAGYPGIYVRAADGFDALVYYVFSAYEDYSEDYRGAYGQKVTELMAELRQQLGLDAGA